MASFLHGFHGSRSWSGANTEWGRDFLGCSGLRKSYDSWSCFQGFNPGMWMEPYEYGLKYTIWGICNVLLFFFPMHLSKQSKWRRTWLMPSIIRTAGGFHWNDIPVPVRREFSKTAVSDAKFLQKHLHGETGGFPENHWISKEWCSSMVNDVMALVWYLILLELPKVRPSSLEK